MDLFPWSPFSATFRADRATWRGCKQCSRNTARMDRPNRGMVQALIDISGLIRALPQRTRTNAADYINRRYLHAARDSMRPAA